MAAFGEDFLETVIKIQLEQSLTSELLILAVQYHADFDTAQTFLVTNGIHSGPITAGSGFNTGPNTPIVDPISRGMKKLFTWGYNPIVTLLPPSGDFPRPQSRGKGYVVFNLTRIRRRIHGNQFLFTISTPPFSAPGEAGSTQTFYYLYPLKINGVDRYIDLDDAIAHPQYLIFLTLESVGSAAFDVFPKLFTNLNDAEVERQRLIDIDVTTGGSGEKADWQKVLTIESRDVFTPGAHIGINSFALTASTYRNLVEVGLGGVSDVSLLPTPPLRIPGFISSAVKVATGDNVIPIPPYTINGTVDVKTLEVTLSSPPT